MPLKPYKYTLVVFVDDKKDPSALASIDAVPSSWVIYDEKNDSLQCPCYDEGSSRNIEMFTNAVKSRLPPPPEWKLHRVRISGYASKIKLMYNFIL